MTRKNDGIENGPESCCPSDSDGDQQKSETISDACDDLQDHA